ncbi:zinc finger protein zas1 [Xylariaceae sp. FL1272]|nr:zinc finger protein zas1 [Xylariaceae sp. FL1272]
MASNDQPSSTSSGAAAGYKRASRKGAPRKFACEWPSCDKIYSRAEHLQRHQLNHEPKQIFKCDVPDCNQMFVRVDLLARHKKRHSTSYVPRNRTSSFSVPQKDSPEDGGVFASSPSASSNGQPATASTLAPAPAHTLTQGSSRLSSGNLSTSRPTPSSYHQQSSSVPLNASVLLSPNSLTSQSDGHHTPSWGQPMDRVSMLPPKSNNYFAQDQTSLHDHSSFMPFANVPMIHDTSDLASSSNFALWLFDNQRGYGDFNVANMPFLEGGLESPFNNNVHYDHESLTSRSHIDHTPPHHSDMVDEVISENRRHKLISWINMFRQKQTKYDSKLEHLLQESGGDYPGLRLDFLHDCLRHYWDFVSPRLPIVHQPTFSPTRCSTLLLLVIVALGAAQIHVQSPTGDHEEYKSLADLIIHSVRLEILGDDGASPPVDLWVAQALLLVEYYEKMSSTRKLHERGQIYHSVTLNLLRRGSPLIGKAGIESPLDEHTGAEPSTDDRTWWIRWAETEAMHRVVFAAFMMDIVHAAMFGHAADMAPHEIRLPLPCDEALWLAPSHESVRQQEANLRMYGVKPVFFLDGLKRALHGREVQTHSFGRMIIMCGLLSVGWHLRRRETHLKWLEMTPNASDMRDKWFRMLLKAFDDWKTSFDAAVGSNDSETDGSSQQPGLIQSAAVLYHLAHISMYVDIIDCQVYAGAKRLLGRKVSSRDLINVNQRMAAWVSQSTTRHAVLHAFKVLDRILLDPRQKKTPHTQQFGHNMMNIQYSARADADPHRPWIMYYATLSIWCFAQALRGQGHANPPHSLNSMRRNSNAVPEFLSRIAALPELDATTSNTLYDGLPELLDVACALSSRSHSELSIEACDRLLNCKEIMFGVTIS